MFLIPDLGEEIAKIENDHILLRNLQSVLAIYALIKVFCKHQLLDKSNQWPDH